MNFFQKVETPPITLISYNEPVRFTRVNYWQASYIFTRSILFLKMGPTRAILRATSDTPSCADLACCVKRQNHEMIAARQIRAHLRAAHSHAFTQWLSGICFPFW
jgi:hypothetical protein